MERGSWWLRFENNCSWIESAAAEISTKAVCLNKLKSILMCAGAIKEFFNLTAKTQSASSWRIE
jgi:hypothetical protein